MKDEEYYKLVKSALNSNRILYDDDLLQEIVTSVAEKMKTYDEERGNKTTYIYKVTITTYQQILRKRYAYKRLTNVNCTSLDKTINYCDSEKLSLIETQKDNKTDIEYELEKESILKEISPLIEKPLELWLQGKNQKEIAEICGLNSQANASRTINSNIVRIRNYCKSKGITFIVKEVN